MRRRILLVLVLISFTAVSAKAVKQFLRPISLDSAYINTEKKNEIRAGFDYLRDGNDNNYSVNSYSVNVKYKRAFDTEIPTRASVSLGLELLNEEFDESFDFSELDFSNMVVGLEAAPLNKEDLSLVFYFDQTIPTGFGIGYLSPINTDTYAFHIGTRYQVKLLDRLRLFGDLSYIKSFSFDDDSEEGSLDYFSYINELVLDTGTKINPTLGFASNNLINAAFDSGDQFFIIPGVIIPFGEEDQSQARIGVPIGLAQPSGVFGYDIGVQANFFTIF
ncbi:MAG: hypothetical protein OXU45_04890 [Candidatus Melainabacteria bacterium]|nr:hypothetical protein [Candidatus Melainabacteria bacterium]